MSQPSNQNLSELLQQGLAHHQAGRMAEAQSIYSQALAQDPSSPDALRLLGLLARQEGKLSEARDFLSRALASKPGSSRLHFELGVVWFETKEMDRAIANLQQAITLQPDLAEAYQALGNAYAACWFLSKARECYAKALALLPGLAGTQQCLDLVKGQEAHVAEVAAILVKLGNGSVDEPAAAGGEPLMIEAREFLPHVLNQLKLTGTGVEIGVKEGYFSEHLLTHWQGTLLYSVDLWRELPASEYEDSANLPQAKQDEFYMGTIRRLTPFMDRSVIWRMASKDAAGFIPDQSLDFCYVDADHSQAAVKEDLALWYPKVRPGGILAGHDYIPDGSYSFGTFGVKSAVDEFVREKGLRLILSKDQPFRSWVTVKR